MLNQVVHRESLVNKLTSVEGTRETRLTTYCSETLCSACLELEHSSFDFHGRIFCENTVYITVFETENCFSNTNFGRTCGVS